MGLAYPTTGYRNRPRGRAALDGFQGPVQLPTPANDNRPPLRVPRPANDNVPPARPRVPPAVKQLGGIARRGLRFFPPGRLLDAGLEVYELYRGRAETAGGQQLEYPGWNLAGQCNSLPIHRYINTTQSLLGACLTGQTVGSAYPVSQPVPTSYTRIMLYNVYRTEFGFERGRTVATFWREAPGPAQLPRWVEAPGRLPIWRPPLKVPYPALDPFSLPIGQPVSTPKPIPYRALPYLKPNPWRSPSEQTIRMPRTVGRARPEGLGSIELYPNPGNRIRPGHALKPAPKGTKERKFRIYSIRAGSALGRSLSVVTEAKDFVDAIYDALPDKYKRRWHSPHEKAWLIYRHFLEIDVAEAIQNVIENQIEDWILGKAAQQMAKASRRRGSPFGLTVGPAI